MTRNPAQLMEVQRSLVTLSPEEANFLLLGNVVGASLIQLADYGEESSQSPGKGRKYPSEAFFTLELSDEEVETN